jgi:hypothetical protein
MEKKGHDNLPFLTTNYVNVMEIGNVECDEIRKRNKGICPWIGERMAENGCGKGLQFMGSRIGRGHLLHCPFDSTREHTGKVFLVAHKT